MCQQESEEAEKKLGVIEEQIHELEHFAKGLDEIKKIGGKEVLASVGKGVFVKAEAKDDGLFVNVGAGVFVKKSAVETKGVIEDQVRKFKHVRIQLMQEIENYACELRLMLEELEKEKAGQEEK